ncbi:fibrohexamerin-like [Aricia agestis]|uniref:fibrohexamerin-like n=1 Tax=Aricia agestis TaxID=91739 RepID=UPI001C208C8F|nr:fibrohexamerin-like [Aricia agestis]
MLAFKLFLYFNILLLCYGQDALNKLNEIGTDPTDEHIERPCEIFDKFCIRKFFAQHSKCKPVDGPVPDPLYRDKSTSYVPHVNITFIPNSINIRGLNGRIEEFYINRVTDKLVLAVEFTNLNATSDYVYLRLHRRAQEPIVVRDYGSIQYDSLSMTIIIPNLKNLQLEKSEVFAFVSNFKLVLGPNLAANGDPEVQRAMAEMMANYQITVREIVLNDSPFYVASYIQYNICDFGVYIP